MNMRIAEAVEVIKREIREKHGVEPNISIAVHTREHTQIDKDKADQIVREVSGVAYHQCGTRGSWANNYKLLNKRPFDITAFYEEIPFTPEPEQLEAEVR